MFLVVQLLASWLAWRMGVQLAHYFEFSRPPKLLALAAAPVLALVLLLVLMVLRYYVFGALINDDLVRVEFVAPFDPAFFGLYSFFAYGGAVSFYPKKNRQ